MYSLSLSLSVFVCTLPCSTPILPMSSSFPSFSISLCGWWSDLSLYVCSLEQAPHRDLVDELLFYFFVLEIAMLEGIANALAVIYMPGGDISTLRLGCCELAPSFFFCSLHSTRGTVPYTHSREHSTHLSGAAAGDPEGCSPFAYAQRRPHRTLASTGQLNHRPLAARPPGRTAAHRRMQNESLRM